MNTEDYIIRPGRQHHYDDLPLIHEMSLEHLVAEAREQIRKLTWEQFLIQAPKRGDRWYESAIELWNEEHDRRTLLRSVPRGAEEELLRPAEDSKTPKEELLRVAVGGEK